jgi:hypothetical protein
MRMTALARTGTYCKRQTHPRVRKDVLVVGLKRLGARTKLLTVNRQLQSNSDSDSDSQGS